MEVVPDDLGVLVVAVIVEVFATELGGVVVVVMAVVLVEVWANLLYLASLVHSEEGEKQWNQDYQLEWKHYGTWKVEEGASKSTSESERIQHC